MKRDMELCRKILEQVEEKSDGVSIIEVLDLPGHSASEVSYQINLLREANFLVAIDCSTQAAMNKLSSAEFVKASMNFTAEGTDWRAITLTWNGHEFLDAIRNDTVWNKIKEKVKEKGGSIPFEVLKTLAMQFTGSLFGV